MAQAFDLDDGTLSREQSEMRDVCRRYVDGVLKPFIRANRGREWRFEPSERLPPEILREADRAGLRGLGVPDEYGGVSLEREGEAQTFALIAAELARGDVGVADKLVQNWKIAVLLRALAAKSLQDEWFPRYMADPGFLMAHCLTEPRGASDRWLPYNAVEANMDTKAEFVDGYWSLTGRKQFISNGYDASLYVVYANTDDARGMLEGTSSFLVPRDTPGLEVTRCNETIGGRYMNNGEIALDNCRVPEDHLLAQGDALKKAGVYFRPGKIMQAAKNLGIGFAAFEDTEGFVHERVQGGRLLIKHQAVAIRIAQMATALEAVSSFLRRAARAVDGRHRDADRLADMVKVFAAEEILGVCKHAMELHGGSGSMLEVGIEKYFRDASVYLHMDATADISNFRIVKAMYPATAGTYAGPE
ncbi:MAG: acyl-CoA dehydrogenase family protein [Acidimicrobiales bacterium]